MEERRREEVRVLEAELEEAKRRLGQEVEEGEGRRGELEMKLKSLTVRLEEVNCKSRQC